jgi:hypothetical protein
MSKEAASKFLDRVTAEPQLQTRVRESYASGGDRLAATLELGATLGLEFSAGEFIATLEERYLPQAGAAADELSSDELEHVSGGALDATLLVRTTSGVTIAFPDVCKTPAPGGPVPIPYPTTGD